MRKAFTLLAVIVMAVSALAQNNDTTKQQPAQKQSIAGIYNGMTGTYITVRGIAPYKKMPTFDGTNEFYWPKFGVQVGAGQAIKYFTYEGVLEYMQTVHPYYDNGLSVIETINTLQGSVRAGGMLPIQIGNVFVIIPNVKGLLGGSFSLYGGFTTRFQAGVSGGVDFGFKLGGNKMVTLGIVYEYRWFVNRSTTLGCDFLGGQFGIVI